MRVVRSCICGSDLWPYNSAEPDEQGTRIGHEFLGKVFDRTVGLDDVPDGYRAMNEREALKVLVAP